MTVSGWNCGQKMPTHSPWLLGTCWEALLLEVISQWKLWPGQVSQASGSSEVKLCTAGVHSFIHSTDFYHVPEMGWAQHWGWVGAHCDETGIARWS